MCLALAGCGEQGAGSTTPDDAPPRLGYEGASSSDLSSIPLALDPTDLEAVAARGVTLWKMQRAMRLGDRAFSSFVGVTATKFLPVVAIDRSGSSGEVAFYRWTEAQLEDGVASPEEAERWVVVSLTLDPDEVLEPQELGTRPNGEQQRMIAAMLMAQSAAEAEHRGARWVAHAFRERTPAGNAAQTRIYLIGSDDASPDLEFVVSDPGGRRDPAKISEQSLQLTAEAAAKLPLETPAERPGASTVARAVATATVTEKPVTIVDRGGNKWSVAPKTGQLSRQ